MHPTVRSRCSKIESVNRLWAHVATIQQAIMRWIIFIILNTGNFLCVVVMIQTAGEQKKRWEKTSKENYEWNIWQTFARCSIMLQNRSMSGGAGGRIVEICTAWWWWGNKLFVMTFKCLQFIARCCPSPPPPTTSRVSFIVDVKLNRWRSHHQLFYNSDSEWWKFWIHNYSCPRWNLIKHLLESWTCQRGRTKQLFHQTSLF